MTALLVFLVALVYSSVGHGGASGYLAVLSLMGSTPSDMIPSALCLNLLVSGTAFVSYWRAGHFDGKLLWPFALSSIPASYLGGMARIPPQAYGWLLGAALLVAAWRLAGISNGTVPGTLRPPPGFRAALPIGAGIGLLSGILGIGGGIFLSPILLLSRWADAKKTAAVSAGFIWLNSLSAFAAHARVGTLDLAQWVPYVIAAFMGGWLGSAAGARYFNGLVLRRLLAVVLVVAAVKLMGQGI
ncbi:MAG: hypothetical protein A2992_09270 [Elusimicrobia bacterium RIFCSPLOWO2_01_FULL_59_12]|nr:MAG: hypothetical protein A2992_09270 [Elusimicrobia bacterium RIFCSPLOWO2_01_FULL_59_12]